MGGKGSNWNCFVDTALLIGVSAALSMIFRESGLSARFLGQSRRRMSGKVDFVYRRISQIRTKNTV